MLPLLSALNEVLPALALAAEGGKKEIKPPPKIFSTLSDEKNGDVLFCYPIRIETTKAFSFSSWASSVSGPRRRR